MSNNLDRLLEKLKEQADLIDKISTCSDFQYKSTQRLILDYGRPFLEKTKSPFRGEPKLCFKNCYDALWKYPKLSYCEGFAIDDTLNLAVCHAWLINGSRKVIDPTWVDRNFQGSTYLGVIFNKDFVLEMVGKNKHYGILDSIYIHKHLFLKEGFPPNALK